MYLLFDHNRYVPVVRWRRGEQSALELLNPSLKNSLTPLIEIPPIPWDFENDVPKRTVDKHLENIGTQVEKCWDCTNPVFIDALQICLDDEEQMEDGRHPLEFIVDELQAKGIPVIPVISSNYGTNYHVTVKSILAKYHNGICFRLSDVDFDDMKTSIEKFLNFFSIQPKEIDIIVDYNYIDPDYVTRTARLVLGTFSTLPYISDWRTLTFIGTSFPRDLSKIATGTDGSIPRTEWLIYKKILESNLSRIPSFGDYIISNPVYDEIDPRFMQMAAAIRYTVADEFLIFRGYSVRSPKYNGWGQTQGLAQRIIKHSQYSGENYSFGDKYIYDCAHETKSTGNAEVWRKVGTNHHLTLAINEISSLHAL